MSPFAPDRFVAWLAQTPPIWIVVWVGLALLTLALCVLTLTRWGQSRPLRKCAILSLLAHGLLICFATAIKIVHSATEGPAEPAMHVAIVDGARIPESRTSPVDPAVESIPNLEQRPWDPQPSGPVLEPAIGSLECLAGDLNPLEGIGPSEPARIPSPPAPAATHPDPPAKTASRSDPAANQAAAETMSASRPPDRMDSPSSSRDVSVAESSHRPDSAMARPGPTQFVHTHPSQSIYRYRSTTERNQAAQRSGGSGETEAAVDHALAWLARSQSEDGRWIAARYGAGREEKVLGHDRQGAGMRADTGVTGLALLAFLGAGQTHQQGFHRDTVSKGIEFLIAAQGSDGNLAGEATLYARTYCHAMALFALAETFAMTRDDRLLPSVTRAVHYTIISQNSSTGGWRYRPGDLGDTSQLGWQVMALRSVELADVPVPNDTWQGVTRFLSLVTSGPHGGLAGYQPGSPPSRTMTAEAAYCRQLVRSRLEPAAMRRMDAIQSDHEAAAYVLTELPGDSRMNLYYWYYASLFLHGRAEIASVAERGEWLRWNDALKLALLKRQIRVSGPFEGSWAPDCVWGGYGGRVYSTAMAALCLEVYYRYAASEELIATTPFDYLQR